MTLHLPGIGHVHGNFHNYYKFHPVAARCDLFPPGFWLDLWKAQGKPKHFQLLDVGCNEGDLTVALVAVATDQLKSEDVEVKGTGIDIDAELIDRATSKWSGASGETRGVTFHALDFMEIDKVLEKFKGSMNFISLFSITMWIHLNHGDEGLEAFLSLSAQLLVESCDYAALLVEPQPWKAYRNASHRTRKLGLPEPKYWSKIKLRNLDVDINRIVAGLGGFHSALFLGREMWGRQLAVYFANKHEEGGSGGAASLQPLGLRVLWEVVREAGEERDTTAGGAGLSKRKKKQEKRAAEKKQKIAARRAERERGHGEASGST